MVLHKNILIVINIMTVVATMLIVFNSIFHDVEDEDMARNMMVEVLFSTRNALELHHSSESKKDFKHIKMCPLCTIENKYAFVTYVSSASKVQQNIKWYILSASKLAKSLRVWESKADLILLLAEDPYNKVNAFDIGVLESSGWKICRVPFIEGKSLSKDKAKLLTKIHAWKLTEYERVAVLDADMFVKQNPVNLFEIVEKNCSLAVTTDKVYNEEGFWNCDLQKEPTSLYVIIPSNEIFETLKASARRHDEESLIKQYSNKCNIPMEYNVNLGWKYCHRSIYEEVKDKVIMQHFSVAKPWKKRECQQWRIEEECEAWIKF